MTRLTAVAWAKAVYAFQLTFVAALSAKLLTEAKATAGKWAAKVIRSIVKKQAAPKISSAAKLLEKQKAMRYLWPLPKRTDSQTITAFYPWIRKY